MRGIFTVLSNYFPGALLVQDRAAQPVKLKAPPWPDGVAMEFKNGEPAARYFEGRWGYPWWPLTRDDLFAADWQQYRGVDIPSPPLGA